MSRKDTEPLYLVHLMVRGLRGGVPERAPSSIDWNRLFELVAWNSLSGLTWHVVKQEALPAPIAEKWRFAAEASAIRQLHFEAEREILINALTDIGLSVMPIKGATYIDLYPTQGMRSMLDNDILYGFIECGPNGVWRNRGETLKNRLDSMREANEALIEAMEQLGYSVRKNDNIECCHDTSFFKPPYLCFEMHHAYSNNWFTNGVEEFNPWEFAFPDRGCENGSKGLLMKRSREAEYAHFAIHAYKNMIFGGIGLRFLADQWVLLKSWGKVMDWKLVHRILDESNAIEFEQDLRTLCQKVFDGGTISNTDRSWLVRMAREGTYGLPANKSYAGQIRRLASAFGRNVEELPGGPLRYCRGGRVSRPLIPLYSVMWNLHTGLRQRSHLILKKE